MGTSRNILLGVLGVLMIVAIVYYSQASTPEPFVTTTPPEKLVEEALHQPEPVARQQAAVQLADRAAESPQRLREVYRQSDSPEVRAACISGMAQTWEYESMDDLLAALDDESPLVRGRAGSAATRMLGIDFLYKAHDPPEKRQLAAKRMRAAWQSMQTSGKLDEWKARQRKSSP